MALSSLVANETGAHPTYSNGYRIYDYANDPSTIRYKQYAEEAARLGITDPNQVHDYAVNKNKEWGASHGIDANQNWLERHPWVGGLLPAIAGGAVYAAAGGAVGAGAGSEGGVAGGVGEGSASTAATGITPASTQGIVEGAGGGGTGSSIGTGALEGGGNSGVIAGEGAVNASATGGASGSALSRILDGTATTADWLSAGGNLASTGLGVAGARNQANAYNNLAGQYMAMGAPSRARYEASMTPGFDPNSIPGYSGAVDTASKGILARLSATGGNPFGNPGGLIEANKQIISGTALPAIDAYQRLNAGTGGFAGFNAAAPGAATAGIGAQGGVYNAVGSGLAGLLNPQPSLYDTLSRLGVQGLS